MFELTLICPQDQVETLSDALDALDALSVSVEDEDALTDAEEAQFAEPDMPNPKDGWARSRISALFLTQEAAKETINLLQPQDFFFNCKFVAITELADQDWVRLTQSQFEPVEITSNFWIVPTWHEPPMQAHLSIRLDPGLAFGTGTHPTTKMCLRWISKQMSLQGNKKNRVLDYGCGSGILAIAAAKFGAKEVTAIDIDEAAVNAAKLNAIANNVHLQASFPTQTNDVYDIVLANILATPLKVLAPLLCGRVKTGGHLVLAGILSRQAGELKEAYAPYCSLVITDEEDGWILMTGIL